VDVCRFSLCSRECAGLIINTFPKNEAKKQGFSVKVGLRKQTYTGKPVREIVALLQGLAAVILATTMRQGDDRDG